MTKGNYSQVDGVGGVMFRGDPRAGVSTNDEWFTQVLESRQPEVVRRPYLYGSDAGFCPRRNCLLEHNSSVDALVNSAGSGYMGIGVAFERLLAESLQRTGNLILQDQRLIDLIEVKVSGKIDLFFWDREEQLGIIECKTCGDLPVVPKPNHLAQALTYSAISGVDRVYLLYLSRNLNPMNPIQVKTFALDTSSDVLIDTLTTIFLSRYSSDRHLLLPIPPLFKKHTECHYCEFRDYYCYSKRETTERPATNPTIPNNLVESTPVQYIEIESLCRNSAVQLHSTRLDRYQRTLQTLITDYRVTKENVERITALLL